MNQRNVENENDFAACNGFFLENMVSGRRAVWATRDTADWAGNTCQAKAGGEVVLTDQPLRRAFLP